MVVSLGAALVAGARAGTRSLRVLIVPDRAWRGLARCRLRQNGVRMIAVALVVSRWPGSSARSRARSSSPGPRPRHHCRRARAIPGRRTSPGCSAGGRRARAAARLRQGRARGRRRPRHRRAGPARSCSASRPSSATRSRSTARAARGSRPAAACSSCCYPLIVGRPRGRLVRRRTRAAQGVARVAAHHGAVPDRWRRVAGYDAWEIAVLVGARGARDRAATSANIRRLLPAPGDRSRSRLATPRVRERRCSQFARR